jgi:hypothetical protein
MDGGQDLAARLREAWEARQSRTGAEAVDRPSQTPEPESARSLAERLREVAQGIDREALADVAAQLRADREGEAQRRVQEAERLKEQERQRQRDEPDRDSGLSH